MNVNAYGWLSDLYMAHASDFSLNSLVFFLRVCAFAGPPIGQVLEDAILCPRYASSRLNPSTNPFQGPDRFVDSTSIDCDA